MQDMSCLISEPANSPPRILRSDTALERCTTETKETKVKAMPKITRSQNKDIHTKKNTQTVDKSEKTEDKPVDKELNTNLEKNFRCKMCDVTFNSNSNLLKHMKTHKQSPLGSDTDSEESPNSPKESQRGTRKRRVEHNNNGSADNSVEEEQSPTTRKKSKTINNNCITEFKLSCPVCDKRDFSSSVVYEMHMEEKHPDYRRKTPVSGFNDCTFIDFSSEKFPEIAKTVCELNVHQSITEQKFRCKACSRDFPCESALDIHEKSCENNKSDMPKIRSSWKEGAIPNEETRRDDFFAQLNLQNRSPNSIDKKRLSADYEKPKTSHGYYPSDKMSKQFLDTSKDLADIQSILSVTTGTLFKNLTHSREQNTSKEHDQEETQDAFAAEFRKMKLRGEFPCRLCTAVFPNLRALKGHNRVHLSGNGAGPYRCNMCPHSSLDKAALVRHMRTHNGDRPYECAVCNYAFTTKANCERHLRNRHSKISREDVKRSIIYHPSEDPNNDEVNTKLNISRDEIKRSQIFNNCDAEHEDDIKIERTTPVKLPYSREQPAFPEHANLNISMPRDLSIVIPQPRDIIRAHCSNDLPIATTSEDILPPKIKVKGFGQLTQIPEFTPPDSDHDVENYNSDEDIKSPIHDNMPYAGEIPMDLSTNECQEDVLDLSKKKSDDKVTYESEAEDYSSKSSEFNNNNAFKPSYEKQIMLLRQQFLKNANMDPTAGFYANPLSQLYARGGTPFIPPFPLNPYLFQHNPFLAPTVNANIMEMNDMVQKEIIKGLQLSGGSLVGMDPNNILNMALIKGRLQDMQALNNMTNNDPKSLAPSSNIKMEDDIKPQPLQINTDTPTTIPFASLASSPAMSSPKMAKKETVSSQSPNSVKMVIKNGILMPKQKQRRYRTERPFSCEYCSARFTLRSNMERHIKQQHPQHWSQRQKSAMGNFPRKTPISMVHQNLTVPSLTYDSRLNYAKNHSNADSFENDNKNPSISIMNKNYPMIPDHVKHAILAQQLKSHNANHDDQKCEPEAVTNGEIEDEDEEDALVIDEETTDEKNQIKKQIKAELSENAAAKKVAQEILDDVVSKSRDDLNKDFDWKIQGNLISKNPQDLSSDIPTVVIQMNQSKKDKENEQDAVDESSKNVDHDLASVTSLVDTQQKMSFKNFFKNEPTGTNENLKKDILPGEGSEDEEEGLVAPSGSASEGNNSGSDENRSDPETTTRAPEKKKSAYSLAPNRVSCPYCSRKFPWSSSLRRHVLTHTGQKPYKCPHCPLLFTTKSNCDRHLLRKHGSNALQTIIQVSSPPDTSAANSVSIPEVNNQGFMMRNVPERPYKCAQCPSSTFSTRSNLKKHMLTKHGITISDIGMPDSPKEPEESRSRRESSDAEQALTSDDEKSSKNNDDSEVKNDWDHQISKCSPTQVLETPSNTQNSDLPFKCHLCEGSYAERQAALDHIKTIHETEYEILVCKGALETGITFNEELGSSVSGHRSEGGEDQAGEENIEQLRGKFPDYANRKVVCAFCMRRFWSAEDLRRHMRTHTGERPFSCDVCRRRFTLKHSMLRHRKKHSASDNRSCEDMSIASGDEDVPSPSASVSHNNSSLSSNRTISPLPNNHQFLQNTSTPLSSKGAITTPRLTLLNTYQLAINAKNLTPSPEIPSNVNNNNSPPAQSYDGKMKILNSRRELNPAPRTRYLSEDADAHENETEVGSDLIGNLLGISDRGMINKLLSSADEAAKLLGVNK